MWDEKTLALGFRRWEKIEGLKELQKSHVRNTHGREFQI